MRKFVLGALLLLSTLSFGQPRVNEVLPKFIETSDSFSNATQYEYSSYSGKWIEEKNNDTNFFQKIEFKTIEYNSIKYYVMVIHELDGEYKYPSIKQGFYTWNSLRAYIYTSEQYTTLKNYQSVSSNYNEIRSSAINDDGIYGLELSVINTLKNNRKPFYKATFKIKKENENTIRFILPLKIEYNVLEKYYGFDKKYFEATLVDFNKIFTLK
jgi:hypothetical protein